MVMLELKLAEGVPESEFSRAFVQGMCDRMSMSYYKYGLVRDAYPHKVDAIKEMKRRIEMYEQTGNTEMLMDAGNFAMIEYMHPAHPLAHFRATDSKETKGRVWRGEVDPLDLPNDLRKHVK